MPEHDQIRVLAQLVERLNGVRIRMIFSNYPDAL